MANQTPDSMLSAPRARLLLGGCRFQGIFDCPCREGSAFESLKSLGQDISCEKCGHSLSLHKEHEGVAPVITGPPLRIKTEYPTYEQGYHLVSAITPVADPVFLHATEAADVEVKICERKSTVLKIAKLLASGDSVLIWGMKGTGKTTLANLLHELLVSKSWNVFFIQTWPNEPKKRIEDILLEHARAVFPELTIGTLATTDMAFIIDEAQEALLRKKTSWNSLIRASQASATRPRFCFFSNQVIIPEDRSVFAEMPEVSYLETHSNGGGLELSLFFTIAEFEDFFKRNRAVYGFELDRQAADHIHLLTAGHPGILRLILRYIKLKLNGANAGGPSASPTILSRADVMAITHNDDQLFIFLGDNVYPGSYARENKSVIRVFEKLLDSPEGKIGWDSASMTVIKKCFSCGLLSLEEDPNEPEGDAFRFPSPLHARWAQWYHKIETSIYAGELSP